MNNDSYNIGEIMARETEDNIRKIVTFCGALVYVAGIVYAEIHGYSLLSRGVDPDLLFWATLGIIALGISALALPVGLHYSFDDSGQRWAAYAFYVIDLGLLTFNAITSYTTRINGTLPAWLSAYMMYGLPATPIFAGIGWSVLALLDPSHRERQIFARIQANTRLSLAKRVAKQSEDVDINTDVEIAAYQLARELIGTTIGVDVSASNLPARLPVNEKAPQLATPKPARSAVNNRFFGRKFRTIASNNQETEAVPAANPTNQRQEP